MSISFPALKNYTGIAPCLHHCVPALAFWWKTREGVFFCCVTINSVSYLVGTDVFAAAASSEMPCRALRLGMAYHPSDNRCLHRSASLSKNTSTPNKSWWLASWLTIGELQCRCTRNKEGIRHLHFYFSEFIIRIHFYNEVLMLKLWLCSFLLQSF